MPTHLRRVLLVGAPLSEMGMQAAQERLGVTIAHLAGDAETFPLARGGLEPAPDASTMMAWRCPDRIDVEVRDQDGELAQPGEIGDLHVGGPTIANGFWHRPELSLGHRMPRGMWLTAYRGSVDAHATLHHLSLEPGQAVHRDEDVCGLNEVQESLYSHPGVLEVFLLAVRNDYGLPVVWACLDLQGLRHVQLGRTNPHLARARKGPLPGGTATLQSIEPPDLQGARPPATPDPDRDRSARRKLTPHPKAPRARASGQPYATSQNRPTRV